MRADSPEHSLLEQCDQYQKYMALVNMLTTLAHLQHMKILSICMVCACMRDTPLVYRRESEIDVLFIVIYGVYMSGPFTCAPLSFLMVP